MGEKNLNKDFTNTGRGGGHHFVKVFHKIPVFFKRWLPLVSVDAGGVGAREVRKESIAL